MTNKLPYSFDDEVVSKSCYDLEGEKIEIHFERYFDVSGNQYVDKPSVWTIENWSSAKSKLSSDSRYHDLEKHLGIISMVLSVSINGTALELTVNTVDNRYVDLLFDNPKISLL